MCYFSQKTMEPKPPEGAIYEAETWPVGALAPTVLRGVTCGLGSQVTSPVAEGHTLRVSPVGDSHR